MDDATARRITLFTQAALRRDGCTCAVTVTVVDRLPEIDAPAVLSTHETTCALILRRSAPFN